MKNIIAIALLLISTASLASEDTIGTVGTSGMLFKDTITIQAFDDPTIKGVTCYITLPSRTLSFDDPTDTSIACRKIGPIIGDLKSNTDIFSASKSIFFKTNRVDRFYDSKRKVLIYLSYTVKLSGDNSSHSISVVPVE
jgi:CreA protein